MTECPVCKFEHSKDLCPICEMTTYNTIMNHCETCNKETEGTVTEYDDKVVFECSVDHNKQSYWKRPS